ncbi:hypothetical protein OXX79_003730 [Metschnikowia pulcherrima]
MLFRFALFATILAAADSVAAKVSDGKVWLTWKTPRREPTGRIGMLGKNAYDSSVITYVAESMKKRDVGLMDLSSQLMPILNGEVHAGDQLSKYYDQVDQYQSLLGEPDTNVERFKRNPGDSVNCSSVAEISRRYQIICHWAKHVWDHVEENVSHVWLNQQAYVVVPEDGRFIAKPASFEGHIGDIASTIKEGSTDSCMGVLQNYGDWSVMTSVHKNEKGPCFTDLEKDQLESVLNRCVREAERRSAVSYCCRIRDHHGWTGDVRIQRSDVTFANIKDMRCAY